LPEKAFYIYQDMTLNRWYRRYYANKADFIYYKARNYHVCRRFEEARKLYSEYLSIGTDKKYICKSLFFKGMLDYRTKHFDESKKELETLITAYPDSPWAPLAKSCISEIKKMH